MKTFKLLTGNESILNRYGDRTINLNYYNTIDLSARQTVMRWIVVEMCNLHFRIYTHLSLRVIQHVVTNTIEPFLFETNNHENRDLILRMLQARFHRAITIENETV